MVIIMQLFMDFGYLLVLYTSYCTSEVKAGSRRAVSAHGEGSGANRVHQVSHEDLVAHLEKNWEYYYRSRFARSDAWTEWTDWSTCLVGKQLRIRGCKLQMKQWCHGPNRQLRSCPVASPEALSLIKENRPAIANGTGDSGKTVELRPAAKNVQRKLPATSINDNDRFLALLQNIYSKLKSRNQLTTTSTATSTTSTPKRTSKITTTTTKMTKTPIDMLFNNNASAKAADHVNSVKTLAGNKNWTIPLSRWPAASLHRPSINQTTTQISSNNVSVYKAEESDFDPSHLTAVKSHLIKDALTRGEFTISLQDLSELFDSVTGSKSSVYEAEEPKDKEVLRKLSTLVGNNSWVIPLADLQKEVMANAETQQPKSSSNTRNHSPLMQNALPVSWNSNNSNASNKTKNDKDELMIISSLLAQSEADFQANVSDDQLLNSLNQIETYLDTLLDLETAAENTHETMVSLPNNTSTQESKPENHDVVGESTEYIRNSADKVEDPVSKPSPHQTDLIAVLRKLSSQDRWTLPLSGIHLPDLVKDDLENQPSFLKSAAPRLHRFGTGPKNPRNFSNTDSRRQAKKLKNGGVVVTVDGYKYFIGPQPGSVSTGINPLGPLTSILSKYNEQLDDKQISIEAHGIRLNVNYQPPSGSSAAAFSPSYFLNNNNVNSDQMSWSPSLGYIGPELEKPQAQIFSPGGAINSEIYSPAVYNQPVTAASFYGAPSPYNLLRIPQISNYNPRNVLIHGSTAGVHSPGPVGPPVAETRVYNNPVTPNVYFVDSTNNVRLINTVPGIHSPGFLGPRTNIAHAGLPAQANQINLPRIAYGPQSAALINTSNNPSFVGTGNEAYGFLDNTNQAPLSKTYFLGHSEPWHLMTDLFTALSKK